MTANIIKITAAELQHGDDVDGDIIDTVEVLGTKVRLTYLGDDTRIRVGAAQVYTVIREGGVSTVVEAAPAPVDADALRRARHQADIEAGAKREHDLQLSFRRDRYRAYGRS